MENIYVTYRSVCRCFPLAALAAINKKTNDATRQEHNISRYNVRKDFIKLLTPDSDPTIHLNL